MDGQRHVLAAFPPGEREPVRIVNEEGWAPEPFWMGAGSLPRPVASRYTDCTIPANQVNTLRTGDADLRFYITTVQDG